MNNYPDGADYCPNAPWNESLQSDYDECDEEYEPDDDNIDFENE